MTTYAYRITFDDSESIMLEEALKMMIEHCDEKLKAGAGAPWWSHQQSALAVLARLYKDTEMTSWNTFFSADDIFPDPSEDDSQGDPGG